MCRAGKLSFADSLKTSPRIRYKRHPSIGTHDDGDVVFNSKVGDDVYYLETIPAEEHMAGLSVEHDQEKASQDEGDIEVIEARAYKGTTSWHERLGHLHGHAI